MISHLLCKTVSLCLSSVRRKFRAYNYELSLSTLFDALIFHFNDEENQSERLMTIKVVIANVV